MIVFSQLSPKQERKYLLALPAFQEVLLATHETFSDFWKQDDSTRILKPKDFRKCLLYPMYEDNDHFFANFLHLKIR